MKNAMDKHEPFIMDTLLPLVMAHSARVKCTPDEAALAVLMSMGTILQTRGYTADSLLMAIQGSAHSTHDAPGGLQ